MVSNNNRLVVGGVQHFSHLSQLFNDKTNSLGSVSLVVFEYYSNISRKNLQDHAQTPANSLQSRH